MEQVAIEDYNPDWALEYRKEAIRIQEIFGGDLLGIEHIGSTAVEGLGAKPLIDFMAGVADLKLTEQYIEALSEIGYEHVVHEHFPNRRFFRKGLRRAGTHHLHVYRFGGAEWNRQLLFRDYLRSHPEALRGYDRLKRELAEKHRHDRTAYTNAKHDFITGIIEKAEIESNARNSERDVER